MKTTKEESVKILAEIIQKECHKFIDELIKKNPKLNYESCMNVWIFTKLAEMQMELHNKTSK